MINNDVILIRFNIEYLIKSKYSIFGLMSPKNILDRQKLNSLRIHITHNIFFNDSQVDN